MSCDTIPLEGLGTWLEGKFHWFIFSISYETRSSVIRACLSDKNVRVIGFYNANHSYNNEALASARSDSALVEVPLDSDAPLKSLDAMRSVIADSILNQSPVNVAIDITCFTRESLAVLMMTLHHLLPAGSRVHCLYNKASSYANSQIDSSSNPAEKDEHAWLTKGIVGIRSILGYRGRVRLVADTHLILLPGFEEERAHGIIDTLQPNRLTIGQIDTVESIRPEFAPVVGKMNERLVSYYPEQVISRFTFSSRDPVLTRQAVLGCVTNSENTVIACLNTKLAMMGVIMAALVNRDIQLIYAQPVQYNTKCMSDPGDEALVFEVPIIQ